MSPVVKLYDLYIKSLNKCYYYKEKKDSLHLLNEIGVLKGLEASLKANNVGVANIEFKHFIEIESKLFKTLIIKNCS